MSRYINADAIEYHEVFDGDEFVRVAYGDDIDELPTADVVEVVHGEWVLNDDQVYECKDCGYVPSFDGYTYFNYCPNCGSKMKGVDDGCNY